MRPLPRIVLLCAAVALIARAAPAAAFEPTCAAPVHAWVADAAHAAGVEVRAVGCTRGHVHLRLLPPGAATLDVDVERGATQAFRTAGATGLSPMLEVDDFGTVPAAERVPFERLVAWAQLHPDRIAFGDDAQLDRAQPPTSDPKGKPRTAWLLLAAVASMLAGFGRPRAFRSRDAWMVGGLVGLALGLRMWLGAWGPLRINGLGPLWIMAAAVDPRAAASYGPGYAEIFGPLVRHVALPVDTVVFAANGAISALTAGLVFTLARSLGVDGRRASVAGLAFALDPASIRIATTESYVVCIAALVVLAAVAAAGAVVATRRQVGLRAACLWASAGLFCAQAVRVHPAAWIPAALAPLAAAALPRLSRPARVRFGIVSLSVCAAAVVATSASDVRDVLDAIQAGQLMNPVWRVPLAAWFLVPAAPFLLAVASPRGPALLGAVLGVALLFTRATYDQSPLWQASFDCLYLPLLLVGAATLIPASWSSSRALLPVALAALVGLAALDGPRLWGHTTDHEEYVWARRWLTTELPPSCRLVYVGTAGRRNLFLPTYLVSREYGSGDIVRIDGQDPVNARFLFGTLGCTYYVRTSLCSTADGRPACDDLERQLALTPVAHVSFVAAPSGTDLPYDRSAVESVIAHVDGYRAEP